MDSFTKSMFLHEKQAKRKIRWLAVGDVLREQPQTVPVSRNYLIAVI